MRAQLPRIARRALSTARVETALASLAEGMARPMTDIEVVSGAGSYITSSDGERLLDFTCGIGVTNTGHCHPRVVAAAQAQMGKLMHGQVSIGMTSPLVALTNRMLGNDGSGRGSLLPASHDRLMFSTTGAEAVENAVRLARAATGKPNLIVMQGGYHGRTIGTLALTRSKVSYGVRNHPQMPGVFVAPFPYDTQSPGIDADGSLYQLELLLKQQTAPSDTAAVIVEPVLGEGGYVPPPRGWLQGLRALCDAHGLLLVFDEVQSGFGRTGKLWAHQHAEGVEPDVLVMAKGIASGLPLSAISSRAELTRAVPPGAMGGTYAANPVACAAALATLDVFEEEDLVGNAAARGEQLLGGLRALVAEHDDGVLKEARGVGLMVGLEFGRDAPAGTAAALSRACRRRGLLLLTTSVFETLRFIPPLNVSAAEVDTALSIVGNALREVVATAADDDAAAEAAA